jgi:hypothetical protein
MHLYPGQPIQFCSGVDKCWEDADILKYRGKCRTLLGLILKVQKVSMTLDGARHEAQAAGGLFDETNEMAEDRRREIEDLAAAGRAFRDEKLEDAQSDLDGEVQAYAE